MHRRIEMVCKLFSILHVCINYKCTTVHFSNLKSEKNPVQTCHTLQTELCIPEILAEHGIICSSDLQHLAQEFQPMAYLLLAIHNSFPSRVHNAVQKFKKLSSTRLSLNYVLTMDLCTCVMFCMLLHV